MRIEQCLNVSPEEIQDRKHNIWLGISLGNKYFSADNLESLIKGVSEITHDKALIVVGDAIHAKNLQIFDELSEEKAQIKAIRLGEEVKAKIGEITGSKFPQVKIASWNDITADFQEGNTRILYEEYGSNGEFREKIIEIIKEGRKDKLEYINDLPTEELDVLASYVLEEIPFFINPVYLRGNSEKFTVVAYPGMSVIDNLCMGLRNNKVFPEIANKLKFNREMKVGIIEVYAN